MSDDSWNAFITHVEPGEARPGPLSGRTLAVKDLFDTAGVRTTYGSRIYAEHVPERTAVAVQRLLDAGAVLVGKTHLPEFAWSVLGQNPWYGTCGNPTHPGKTTGGSSSGSAAALANAYGGYGERVERTEDFEAAFERALASEKPAVLELPVDPERISPRVKLSELQKGAG